MRALFQPSTISSRFNACAGDTGRRGQGDRALHPGAIT